ncbi:MAG: carbon-nitrogen hydrolase family protein, partial [Gammaproteobacteria bacterium]
MTLRGKADMYHFLRRLAARRAIVSVATCAILAFASAVTSAEEVTAPDDWQAVSPRDELRPQFIRGTDGGTRSSPALIIATDNRAGLQGWWQKPVSIEGGKWYRFTARRRTNNASLERRNVFARIDWGDGNGRPVNFDEPVVDFFALGKMTQATPEFPAEETTDSDGWTTLGGVYRAPAAAQQAVIELHLQWATGARVEWRDATLTPCDAPTGRHVRLAAVHFSPNGKTPQENCRQFEPLVADAARQKADLVVLPETLTLQGTGLSYADVAEPIPGPSTAYFSRLAREFKLSIVLGLVERDGHLIYNVAVLIGPDGSLLGKYRKVCLPRTEIEAGVMPGDSYPVFR